MELKGIEIVNNKCIVSFNDAEDVKFDLKPYYWEDGGLRRNALFGKDRLNEEFLENFCCDVPAYIAATILGDEERFDEVNEMFNAAVMKALNINVKKKEEAPPIEYKDLSDLNIADLNINDVFLFGKYADESIAWRILDIKDKKALIITDKIIDAKRYAASKNIYRPSEIRKWLNRDFYDTFTDEEKKKIELTIVDNSLESTMQEKNDYICTNTKDYIFLLSAKESVTYFKTDDSRIASGTMYAIRFGRLNLVNPRSPIACWWLRSPYQSQSNRVCYISYKGDIKKTGISSYECYGIRPACWINLE